MVLFFASGALPVLVVQGQEQRAGIGTAVLLLTYTLRLALAVVVLRAVGASDAVDARWTGFAVIAGALAWVTAQAVATLRPHDAADPAAGRSPGDSG